MGANDRDIFETSKPKTDQEILERASTMRYTSPEERKIIVEALVRKAQLERPDIDYHSIKNWTKSQMPFWSTGKVEDYARSVLGEIIKILKERKEAKQIEQTKTN